MKFDLFVLPTVPGTYEARVALRPIGRNEERYQRMLQELRDIAVLAEDLGFDALSTTEHPYSFRRARDPATIRVVREDHP
jgi:alkanesulfonate monooxygenase SsuD/methylene tetrahydromethanopterin reductase-like flavin-dependent oxidoreductase (luciferase family)